MKKLVLLACIGVPLSVLAQGGLPDKPYIYVEGKAEVQKAADMVTLRFDVVARNPDQIKANQEVQAKANKIFALLTEKKIVENDVVASDLKSEPQFENNEESGRKRGKIIGYSVTRTFAAKVRDMQIFARLVDDIIAIGVEFSSIEPALTKEKETEDEMWEKALTNAREKAGKTLKATDMKIDSIFALSPVALPEIRQRMFGYEQLPSAAYSASGPVEGLRVVSQYRLAPITVSQSVHVIYLISPVK